MQYLDAVSKMTECGEGNGNPLQYPCLENPMDRGAWRAAVHGVAGVRHDLVTKLPPPPVQEKKKKNGLCSFPRQTIQYHSNPSLCPDHNAEEAEVEWFYEDL